MLNCIYRLELMLRGPILTQASGTLAFGVDTAMQRYNDEPVLNGSLIRGNIRHILYTDFDQHEEYMSHLSRWFPEEKRVDTLNGNDDTRSALNFDLFWRANCRGSESGERIRIEIEDEKGNAASGSLQIIEDLFPAGSLVTFSGNIRARFKSEDEQASFEKWFDKALQWFDAVGSLKGVGYGRVAAHRLIPLGAPLTASARPTPSAQRVGLRLRFDRPFCIGKQVSRNDNRIVSSGHIPGEVIKGVLARRWKENGQGDLADLGFDNIVINHARPTPRGRRSPSRPFPLNAAVVGKCNEVKTYTQKPPKAWKSAPKFEPDWKSADRRKVAGHLNLPLHSPDRLLLVRTAIEQGKGLARESALFSLECVKPENHDWIADLELGRLNHEQRQQFMAFLASLPGGELTDIGKTGACACISLEPAFTPPAELNARDSQWQITLQTRARLLPHDLQPPNVNSDKTMQEAYAQYWRNISEGALKLVTHFANQTLFGGADYHFRFCKPHGKPYRPEWHTTVGSVFIVEAAQGQEAEARACIACFSRYNLPACENDDYPAQWDHTPALPEHGYGQIDVAPLRKGGEHD